MTRSTLTSTSDERAIRPSVGSDDASHRPLIERLLRRCMRSQAALAPTGVRTPAVESVTVPKIARLPRLPGKKLIAFAAATVVLFAAIVGGLAAWRYLSSHESTDDAYVDGNITQISSRVSGTVSKVLVSDNQYVKAGQLLVVLDPSDYNVKVALAQAELEKAQRQVQQDRADVSQTATTASAQDLTASGDVLRAQANSAAAKSDMAQAQAAVKMEIDKINGLLAQQNQDALDLQRYQNLVSQGAVSRQQYDQARTAYDVAVAQTAATQQELVQLKARVDQSEAALQQAYSDLRKAQASQKTATAAQQQTIVKQQQQAVSQASVDQARADLENAMLQASYCNIVAPVSGRIGKKSVQPGEQIQADQPLFSIIPDSVWVAANFKETQIGRMRPGQAVDITLDAFPGHHFKGDVDSVAPASGNKFALLPADNATGNFTKIVQRVSVKITFDDASTGDYRQLIVPGLSAQVTVDLNTVR